MDAPLAILDLLDELENVFDQPIHLCDVKPEHFGISDFGKVKFLDLDSVFLKSYLGEYSWVSNKADLISETVSLWLKSPKTSCQITPLSFIMQKLKSNHLVFLSSGDSFLFCFERSRENILHIFWACRVTIQI